MYNTVPPASLIPPRMDDVHSIPPPPAPVQRKMQDGLPNGQAPATLKQATAVGSGLSERIELLDAETRSCWRRVEALEDEESSLNYRLMKLEKLRRRERLEILGMEQACRAVEVAMLQAQEEAADFDAQASALESLAQDAAEDADAAASESQRAADSGGAHSTSSRPEEEAASLLSTLRELPAHKERQKHLASVLQQTENKARTQIAEASRAAAELRRSAKTLCGERLPLEHETMALREELAQMTGENEIRARMARTKQIGDGLHRRLQHASKMLASERDSLAQGPAKHLEEEEQQSLELMQAITQAKGRLRSRGGISDQPPRGRAPSTTSTNQGGVAGASGRVFSPPRPAQPRLQMQPSRGSVGRSSYQPGGHRTGGRGWS